MKTNNDILLGLVSNEETKTYENIKCRVENKAWLRESKRIAVKILVVLKEKGLNQKQLAEQMGVSPQYINKLVKGKENLTLETIVRLQNLLQIPLLASYQKTIAQPSTIQTFEYSAEYKTVFMKFDPSKNKYDYKITG